MAFDRHMNLVLGDAEEFRKLPPKKGVPEDEVRLACRRSSQTISAAPFLLTAHHVSPRNTAMYTWTLARHHALLHRTSVSLPLLCLPTPQREARRVLGLVILRGDEVVDLVIEGPPPADETRAAKSQQAPGGPGMGRAAGRGMPVAAPGAAPAGLAGVAPGVGAPAPGQMMPRPSMAAPPVMHAPGMPPPGMPPPGFR